MKTILIFLSIVSFSISTAQNNDDLYYSPKKQVSDKQSEITVDDNAPSEVIYEEPPYSTPDGGQFDGYGTSDASVNTDSEIINPQARKGISDTYSDEYGNTYITNNYYGDYNEFDNYSYSTRLPAPGFGYYDCFYDPFWNYGWGWNNWCGYRWYYQPGFSISIGWGAPWYGWNNWYYPYYGWGWNNWYGGGYYNYYGWGNPYWQGYNHGYWNGYNDGYYNNDWNHGWTGNYGNSNGTYYGPRRVSSGSNTTSGNPTSDINGPRVIKSEMPNPKNSTSVNTIKTRDIKSESNYAGKKDGSSYEAEKTREMKTQPNSVNSSDRTTTNSSNKSTASPYDLSKEKNVSGNNSNIKNNQPVNNNSGRIIINTTPQKGNSPEIKNNSRIKVEENRNNIRMSAPANSGKTMGPNHKNIQTQPERKNIAPENRYNSNPKNSNPQIKHSPSNSRTPGMKNSPQNGSPTKSVNNGGVRKIN
jgi:hypothetical protein